MCLNVIEHLYIWKKIYQTYLYFNNEEISINGNYRAYHELTPSLFEVHRLR